MAWGRRCDLGCQSWPDSDDYQQCPLCGQEATRFSNLKPLEPQEARTIVAQIKFDAFYDDHCKQQGITADGPIKDLKTGTLLVEEGEYRPSSPADR